ncbi:MAG: L-fucose/L-arabinose isomerase family protein [Chloroflexi bacterium]|nr:L-fucose/L-arabinose isomerase family protein [Chloroflexota bacterium]MBP7591069.1 L-fucose/L-arabinose isomerase family protein [Chloroflexota bacterium]
MTTFGVIVTNRNFFADHLVVDGRAKILSRLADLGIKTIIVDQETTPLGAVETWSDAQKCGELFRRHQDEIEGILVSLPNFGNEQGVADAIREARLNVPILVHAFPDRSNTLTAAGRRDAFCGKLSVTNNLYQYGIPFSVTQSHTVDPDSDEFVSEIRKFEAICRTRKGLTSARIGAIGARPGAFKTVRYSEKLFESVGMSVQTLDMSDVFGWVRRLDDGDAKVTAEIERIKQYAAYEAVPAASLTKIAKLATTIRGWMADNGITATAIQCWDSLQTNYGVNVCTLMSMMSDELMPSACETDIAGTVSMYALTLASHKPAALVDWNNNYDNDPNKCIYFHCGNWAKSLVKDIRISTAEVLGTTLGPENTWGALDGRSPAFPLTYARIDTDDRKGVIKAYYGEGRTTNDPLSRIPGNSAVVEVENLQGLMRYVAKNGFAHHCAMTDAHVANVLQEVLDDYLGWQVYYHRG